MKPLQVVAYKPIYYQITGSVEAALMLSQGEFCTNKKSNGGFFCNTSDDWATQTGLTYWKQKSARRILKTFSFWKEKKGGIPRRTFYYVDSEALSSYIANFTSNTTAECTPNSPLPTNYDTPSRTFTEDYAKSTSANMAQTQNNCEDISVPSTNTVNPLVENSPTSPKDSIHQVGVNYSYKTEQFTPSIIVRVKDSKEKERIILTENELFGGNSTETLSTGSSMKKSNQEKTDLINFYDTKLSSTNLMDKFRGNHDWFQSVIAPAKKHLAKTLSVRLGQGKILFDQLEQKIPNNGTISGLLLDLCSEKYTQADILKDLIYIYSDGIVSSWARESKAIKTLLSTINDGNLTFEEVDDCLIWIKNTLNYSLSLSSVIPSLQYFRKYRSPIPSWPGRNQCMYSFSKKTSANSSASPTVAGTTLDYNPEEFIASQKYRRGR